MSGRSHVRSTGPHQTKFEEDWRELEALELDDRTVRRAGEFAETYDCAASMLFTSRQQKFFRRWSVRSPSPASTPIFPAPPTHAA